MAHLTLFNRLRHFMSSLVSKLCPVSFPSCQADIPGPRFLSFCTPHTACPSPGYSTCCPAVLAPRLTNVRCPGAFLFVSVFTSLFVCISVRRSTVPSSWSLVCPMFLAYLLIIVFRQLAVLALRFVFFECSFRCLGAFLSATTSTPLSCYTGSISWMSASLSKCVSVCC